MGTNARTLIWTCVLLFALWLLLTGSGDPGELAVGAVASIVVALLVQGGVRSLVGSDRPLPKRAAYFLAYIPYLFRSIVLANIDVARRVVNPGLPIRPGIVRVRTGLKSPLGRLILTSSITLTPGTLTVDIDGEDLYIHWIDVEAEGVEEASRVIVSGFERYLEVIFG